MADIKDLPGGSKNKIVYLVVVQEPITKKEIRYFISSKVSFNGSHLNLIGYETTKISADKIKTYDEAITIANKNKVNIVDITYPLCRIIRVENITYKQA